ncbi:MAG: GNAT family N-acetyltransferase [Proteobacteria bacterium]|nr:GNAT family N-acetyltransferase [Pseudomonadota bacterium]
MSTLRSDLVAASRAHFAEPLCRQYNIEMTGAREWQRQFSRLHNAAFRRENVNLAAVYSASERDRAEALDALVTGTPLEHHLLIQKDGRTVGCFWGAQERLAHYSMHYTVIHPAHQGRGIYSALLRRLIGLIGSLGFRHIQSRHHADNNRVLIAKLKAGFHITGFEVAPKYGLVVQLCYFFNQTMRDLHCYRIDATAYATALRARTVIREVAALSDDRPHRNQVDPDQVDHGQIDHDNVDQDKTDNQR